MSPRPILAWPDARLAQPAAPVGRLDVEALVAEMFETMYAAPGIGLAAPQLGEMLRLFVMDCGWKSGEMTPLACLDPEIVWHSEETATREEGCLSIPGVSVEVTRPARIRLRWRDLAGAVQERAFDGLEAACAQHEIDHLDGIVTLDRITPEARSAAEAAYAGQGAAG
ncbi:MAG: peptide deformylase [Paracoccaceae bacterium]